MRVSVRTRRGRRLRSRAGRDLAHCHGSRQPASQVQECLRGGVCLPHADDGAGTVGTWGADGHVSVLRSLLLAFSETVWWGMPAVRGCGALI